MIDLSLVWRRVVRRGDFSLSDFNILDFMVALLYSCKPILMEICRLLDLLEDLRDCLYVLNFDLMNIGENWTYYSLFVVEDLLVFHSPRTYV